MLEKLGGVLIMVVGVIVLFLIRVFEPPIFVQIICAFVGTIVCLIGIVVVFAEGSILEEHWAKKASREK